MAKAQNSAMVRATHQILSSSEEAAVLAVAMAHTFQIFPPLFYVYKDGDASAYLMFLHLN